jgi:hypothetical protein
MTFASHFSDKDYYTLVCAIVIIFTSSKQSLPTACHDGHCQKQKKSGA